MLGRALSLAAWIDNGFHGEMDYMAVHGMKRARPAELVAGREARSPRGSTTCRARPSRAGRRSRWRRLGEPTAATVSIYARGRDYHKVLRQRLRQLADRLAEAVGPLATVFTDSAPVLEVELASRSGIGWRGKHTLALDRDAGSMFFLGEIFVDLALPETPAVGAHCGSCSACIDICPTQAIVAPYTLDARRCISYLTIESNGAIPVELRAAIGNRVYGCDDCRSSARGTSSRPRARSPTSTSARCSTHPGRRALGVGRGDFPAHDRGRRDPAHRLRALAAQPPRGRAR